jgi:hypothetical protein
MGCECHVLGTIAFPQNVTWAPGMPKGFCRGGVCLVHNRYHSKMAIQIFTADDLPPEYDWLNVPVWCLVEDGFLFVRVAHPRRGDMRVDVIEGGDPAKLCPNTINVTERQHEYD